MTMKQDLADREKDIRWPQGFNPSQADLFSHNALLINASCERIWGHIVDATKWPQWYPNWPQLYPWDQERQRGQHIADLHVHDAQCQCHSGRCFSLSGAPQIGMPRNATAPLDDMPESVDRVAGLARDVNAERRFHGLLDASPKADGAVSGGGMFAEGTSHTVTATPNSGHSFIHWTKNGSVVSTSPIYTFTMPSANVTLVGVFH
jgi:hypothetical protein